MFSVVMEKVLGRHFVKRHIRSCHFCVHSVYVVSVMQWILREKERQRHRDRQADRQTEISLFPAVTTIS